MMDWGVMLLVWLLIAYALRRIVQQGTWGQPSTRYGLLILLGVGGLFTLRLPSLQGALDAELGVAIPIGFWLRNLAILLMVGGYLAILHLSTSASPEILPWPAWGWRARLLWLPPLMALLLTFILLANAAHLINNVRSHYAQLLLLQWGNALLIGTIIVPITWCSYRLERVPIMRLKLAATLLLCLCYLIPIPLSFWFGVQVLRSGEMIPPTEYGFLGAIAALCIGVQLLPYKALDVFLWPKRYLFYLRLRRLGRKVAALSGEQITPQGIIWPSMLDEAIHLAMIETLDCYYEVEGDTARRGPLMQQLTQIIGKQADASYQELLEALVQVRL